jgi:hypothetical protein
VWSCWAIQTWKLHGVGPDAVTQRAVERYLKFDTGSCSFKELPSKELSNRTDAVVHVPKPRSRSFVAMF